MNITKGEVKAIFVEWDMRIRKDPDLFMTEEEQLKESSEEYGEGACFYFLELLKELKKANK